MVTVYECLSPELDLTRMHLPNTAWGNTVLERMLAVGYTVRATDQERWPDTRSDVELARRDVILSWASPD